MKSAMIKSITSYIEIGCNIAIPFIDKKLISIFRYGKETSVSAKFAKLNYIIWTEIKH